MNTQDWTETVSLSYEKYMVCASLYTRVKPLDGGIHKQQADKFYEYYVVPAWKLYQKQVEQLTNELVVVLKRR